MRWRTDGEEIGEGGGRRGKDRRKEKERLKEDGGEGGTCKAEDTKAMTDSKAFEGEKNRK